MTSGREPLLAVDEIQGNVLVGFNKDHQHLLAVNLADLAAGRRWLARLLPSVSTMHQVFEFNQSFSAERRRLAADPPDMAATWLNIALSHGAIARLASPAEADRLPDRSFVSGLGADRAVFLGDPSGPTGDPTSAWVVGGTGRAPDVFLIVAADRPADLEAAVAAVRPGPGDEPGAPVVVWEERGATLSNRPGHEHFGWKDGVSQPGVRGRVGRNRFLTPRTAPSTGGAVEFAEPGRPLIWPGNFVLGYPYTSPDDGSPQPAPRLARAWFRNGSFLVFRRLNQNVAAFTAFLHEQAGHLARTTGFAGLTAEHLGSLLVGRWPSGAPISRSPATDNPALGADRVASNDVLFGVDTPVTPDGFPPGLEGALGPICPRAAHIVKVNPRDLATNVGPDANTLTHRILRRGIPFGPPLLDPLGGDDGVERGLHFLCYQASIEDQFEFLQQNWANSTGGPVAGGHDLLIGQTDDRRRSIELPSLVAGQQGGTVTAPTQWVTPTGGGYFFAPSLSALRRLST